jgi:uncharacterized membrane protein YfcA
MTTMTGALELDLPKAAVLFIVGALASGINAVAGGGTLISFPVLIAMGIPPIPANATNAVGLWPGSIGGGIGFKGSLGPTKHYLKTLAFPALLGAIAGSVLLLLTPEKLFNYLVPALILTASLVLIVQPRIKAWSQKPHIHLHEWTGAALQLGVAVYGGYFGAGMGIMMLAAYSLFMEASIHEMNAVKTWVGMIINLVASLVFITQGLVLPLPGLILAAGSVVGGFLAARASLKADAEKLRLAIAIYGLLMAAYFAWKAFSA